LIIYQIIDGKSKFKIRVNEDYNDHCDLISVILPICDIIDIFIDILLERTERKMIKDLRDIVIEMLRSTGEAVIAADPEQHVIFINPPAETLTGWEEKEALGKNISDIFHVINEKIPLDNYITDVLGEDLSVTMENQNILISRDGRRIPVYENISPVRDENGNFTGLIVTFRDISRQKLYEKLLRLEEARLEAILKLSHMTSSSLQEITDFVLEEAVSLTGSTMGFLGFMNDDETVLTIHSWSKKTLQECTVKERTNVFSVKTLGLWGESVRQRKPFIINDYSAHHCKKVCPEGHVQILRHMNIPVFDREKIVAVAGVGNKEEDYNMSDVRQLTLLMDGMWKIIKQKHTEEELKRSHEEMELRVNQRTEQLSNAYEELQNEIFRQSLMERELRESEEKFKTIGNSAQDAIVMIDDNGNITFWNRAAEKIFGYTVEDATGKNFHRLIAPKRFHEDHFKAFEEFKKTGKGAAVGKTLELFALRKNGEEFPVELSLSSVNIKDAWHATGILRDITQRKRIEEAIRDSEIFLRSTIDSLSAHIAIVDENGEIITVNKAWEDFSIQNNAETNVCEGANYLQVCDGAEGEFAEEAMVFACGIRSVMKGEKEEFSFEYFCDSPGEQRWFTGKVTKFTIGDHVRTVISHENITDRKKAEDNLLEINKELEISNQKIDEDRKKLQNALDSISSLMQQVLKEKKFSVRFENPNLKKCYEIMKCNKKDCPCYGREAERCWQRAGTYCGGNIQGDFVKKYGCRPDCPVFASCTKDPIYQLGEYFNNMMHILELNNRELEDAYSELKSAQSTILQREKMASIGKLAAGVAHEINNPIGFVSGNLRALNKYIDKFIEFIDIQSEIIENLNIKEALQETESKRKKLKIDYMKEDIKDLIKESLDGTERVSKIVQNLKTFSRIDEASHKIADINESMESTVNIVWNELKYKAEVKKEYGSIPKIKCYPQELNQVFMNLLVNASQAIEKFGEIIIKTWQDEGHIYISISDTGCGMSEEVKNRIFEPFFTTKDVGKGTGLGLSITYDIIKKHNGEITVESEVGKGSTFTVKIPFVE
jgi:PAS domain S-box-containing protein